MTQTQPPAVLELRRVSRRFGSLEVTRDVDFSLHEGARCALIGPNGAGKTTLINLISGRLQPSAGEIRIAGQDVTRLSEAARVKAGVGRTFQITSLFRRLTLEENVSLAVAEQRGVAGLLRPNRAVRAEIDARVSEILATLRIEDAASTRVEVLPYGVQRMAELAVALALRPKLLLLDEPAAGVPRADVGIIFEAIAKLPASLAVLLVEHDIDLVFRFATRIAVLVSGSILVEGTPKEISEHAEVRRLYLGAMPNILELRNVTAGYGRTVILEDVSVSLQEATALAVLGRNGVGKSTLMRTIAGHTTFHAGRIVFEGQDVAATAPWRRARLGVAYVPQEREIFPSLSVLENVTVAARPGAWTLDRIFELFPQLAARRRNFGNQLSGGEQQMLSIARALALQPKLMLLDEPFEGLAPTIVDKLAGVFGELRRAGLSIVLAEQHARLALDMTDEAIALVRGRIVVRGSSRSLIEEPRLLEDALAIGGPEGPPLHAGSTTD